MTRDGRKALDVQDEDALRPLAILSCSICRATEMLCVWTSRGFWNDPIMINAYNT